MVEEEKTVAETKPAPEQKVDPLTGIRPIPWSLAATGIGYFAAYTYFVGFYQYFKVDLHILEFSLIENLLRSWRVFWVYYHGLLTFISLVLLFGPDIVGVLKKDPNLLKRTEPDTRPKIIIWTQTGFAWFSILAVFASFAFNFHNQKPVLVGTALGTLAYLGVWFRGVDTKIVLFVIILSSLGYYMKSVGYKDAMSKVAQKEFSQVTYTTVGSSEPKKSFLIARNQGNYIFLQYAVHNETESRLVIRVINERNLQHVEFVR